MPRRPGRSVRLPAIQDEVVTCSPTAVSCQLSPSTCATPLMPLACLRRLQIEPTADRRLSQGKRVARSAGLELRCAQAGSPQTWRKARFVVGANTSYLHSPPARSTPGVPSPCWSPLCVRRHGFSGGNWRGASSQASATSTTLRKTSSMALRSSGSSRAITPISSRLAIRFT